jgi:hypothetical protein
VIVGPGRPLRFLGLVLFGWLVVRVLWLWPVTGSLPAVVREALPLPIMAQAGEVPDRPVVPPAKGVRATLPVPAVRTDTPFPVVHRRHASPINFALLGRSDQDKDAAPPPVVPQEAPAPPLARASPFGAQSRFGGSFWLAARPGPAGIADAPQLGGSQVGARLRYAIDPARTVSASVRVSAPLAGPGQELGVGIEWRPGDAPVALLAEQRFGNDGQVGGTAVLAVAGIVPTPVAAGFAVEGYGQAGLVLRDRAEAFADGALLVARPIAQIGAGRVAAGVGAWGGAQPGAARLDIGPTASVTMPVAGQAVRLSLDWRQRVAGNARPESGFALTLGTDF